MSKIFPQESSLGGVWSGLDATPTGSDAANDVCADFTGCTQTLQTAPSVAIPVLATHSQTLGSTFKINQEGLWVAQLTLQIAAGVASAIAGIGLDNIAAELAADPAVPDGARSKARALVTNVAGLALPVVLCTTPFGVTRNQAKSATLGIVRVLLSNAAGAGVAAGTLTLAQCSFQLHRVGDLPAQIA